jgi:hypothetical protein
VTGAVPSVEALIAEAIAERLRILLVPIQAALDDLQRRMPPQLGSVADACRVTGLSPATVRRRIRDGSFVTKTVGARVLVDLAALRPAEPAEVARLAYEARAR